MKEYIASDNNPFIFPVIWTLIQLLLFTIHFIIHLRFKFNRAVNFGSVKAEICGGYLSLYGIFVFKFFI